MTIDIGKIQVIRSSRFSYYFSIWCFRRNLELYMFYFDGQYTGRSSNSPNAIPTNALRHSTAQAV